MTIRQFASLLTNRVLPTAIVCLIAALSATAALADEAAPAHPARAGFARVDITPEVGAQIPGGFSKKLAQGVHDPLMAEAAYLGNDSVELAIVGVDLVMIPDDVVRDARQQAEAACGIPAANILIAASHTHNGGPIVDCFGSESDPAYCARVAQSIAQAVAEARGKAVACRVSTGMGTEDSVGFNRRFWVKEGVVKTHPGRMNPDTVDVAGPIDPDVAVIAVEDTEGKLLGCVVNHALHGTVMGGSGFSADWPYAMRETIRNGWGADIGVVFLNGACGDVTQVDNRNPRKAEFGEAWTQRIGMTLGAEVLKVLARAEFSADVPLAVASTTLAAPIRDLAESDEVLVDREAPASGLGSGNREIYLREARLLREMKAASPTVDVEIQAMRVGPAAIVTNPTEFFCELGLAIKQGSTWTPTLVSELSNGYAGYAPTARAFSEGGYEIRTARSSFLAPGVGEQIATASVKLLATLASD